MKYAIEDTILCYVTFRYEVEADSREQALEKYREGDAIYLNNEIGDNHNDCESDIKISEAA